jgi:hypothetical protein
MLAACRTWDHEPGPFELIVGAVNLREWLAPPPGRPPRRGVSRGSGGADGIGSSLQSPRRSGAKGGITIHPPQAAIGSSHDRLPGVRHATSVLVTPIGLLACRFEARQFRPILKCIVS